ncbi:MAG: hypothetical protein J5930_01125 [Treponema sp.]|nr:hypothetical protein [Treponema sp.]
MKKIMHKVMAVISVIAVSIFAGCMSAKHLLEKGDTVSAIEKLAKNLTKKSTSQDDADMFVSVYPYAVEERLENPETVSEVVQGFIESKNAFSLGVALETVKKSLPGGTFIGDENSVRQAVNQADKAYTRAEDLYRIQKAVRAMPVEIGDPRKGNVYLVEKYSDDFFAGYNEASREMSRFVYAIAEAGYPGSGVNENKKLYDLYEKASKYDSNIIGDCNLRQASLAYSIGDALASSSSLQDKKDALDYFKKCDTKKPGYNDVKNRILGCNYDIGTYYLDRFESGKSRSDIKEAISYFGYAKDYKDAVSMKAYCESLLSELDNPPKQIVEETTDVTVETVVPKVTVDFGNLVYSESAPMAALTIKVSNADHLLSAGEFKVSKSNTIGSVEIAANKRAANSSAPMIYVATVSKITGDGSFTISVLNQKGGVIETSEPYTISKAKLFAPPVLSSGKIVYSKTDSDISVDIVVRNLKKTVTLADVVISQNTTGGKLTEVSVGTSSTGYPTYNAVFEGVTQSGTISLSVLGDDGSFIATSDGKTSISYTVNFANVYVPPVTVPEKTDSTSSSTEKPSTASSASSSGTTNSSAGKTSTTDNLMKQPLKPAVTFGPLVYSKTEPSVTQTVSIKGLTYVLAEKSFDVSVTGKAGKPIIQIPAVKTKLTETNETVYGITIPNIEGATGFSVVILDPNGKDAVAKHSEKIDSSKVYVPAVPVEVTFGSVTFSKTDYEATFPVNIKGLDYLLTDGNFVKENQGGLGYTGVTVKTSATKAPKTSETVTYTVTVPGGDRKFKMSTKDKSGRVINERYFEFTDSQFPARPWVQYSGVAYSSTSDEVYLGVSDNGVFRKGKKSIVLSDITVTVNGTGGTVTKVEPYEDYYRITLKGVKQSGTVQLKVKWSNGNYAATSDSWCDTSLKVKPKRAETTLVSYQVDSSKVYVPVAPRSSYKGVTYSATANEIYLQFGVAGVKKTISFADISITSNNTNGQASKIESVVQKAKSDVALYNLILKNVEQSGVVEIRVKGDDGNFLLADEWAESSVMNPTAKSAVKSTGRKDTSIIHYEIDAKKVYAPRTVTFGSVTYSKTESVATFPFTVKGLAYILGTSNFNLKAISGSGIDGVTINANSTQTPKLSDSVTYTVTVPGGDRKFDLVIKDNNAKEISTRHFEFSASQFYQPPRFEYLKDVTYEDNSPIVTAHVYISGVNKVLNGKDMSSVEINSGTASAEILYVARGTGAESNHYEIGLTNFSCSSSSGSVYLRVKGDDGKYLKVTKYATAKHPTDLTLLPVTIDSLKMKLKPTASFYSISNDDIKTSSVTFKLAVWGVNYLLTDSNFVRELTGTVGNVSISTARKTAPKVTERVEYTVNVTGLSKRNDGTLTIKAKDKSGNIIGERFYYFDPSKLTDEQQDKGELLRLQKENALKGYLLQSDSLKSTLDKNSSKTILTDKILKSDVLKVDTSKAVIDSNLSDKLKK